MTNDPHSPSSLSELRRFLDRLLSSPGDGALPAQLQQEYYRTAVELDIVGADSGGSPAASMALPELIERTKACIRLQEPVHPADQSLETMSAPPAMPEATP